MSTASSVAALLVGWLILIWPAAPKAHDIPNDVTVQAILKPDGGHLRLIVRVPLMAMRDMDYPKPPGARNTDLLDLSRADSTLRDAATLWVSDYVDLYENGERLRAPQVVSVRAVLQSDRSFASYDEASAHMAAPPIPPATEYFWSQGLLDVLFEFPIHSAGSRFAIDPRFAHLGLRTLTVVRFLPPGDGVRGFEFTGDPGLVQLDPTWLQTMRQFVALGFMHSIFATDHLLFLACLAIPFRRFRALALIVTAFTVAHTVTMIASAFNVAPDVLWFPPLVETLIATAIVYLAAENVALTTMATPRPRSTVLVSSTLKRRWLIAFGFGLVHGFGFSFGLRQTLQFAGSHLPASLLSFNLGLELGQLLIVALLIPALSLLFRFVVAPRMGTIVLSALVAHTAWHWMTDRFDVLRKFHVERPAIDAAFIAGAMRWMMLLVVSAGLYWLVFSVWKPRSLKSEL